MPTTKWQNSEAKKLLTRDIVQEKVTDRMGPADVYAMHEEYKQYNYENFRTNPRNLRQSLHRLQGHADADSAALAHNLQVRPLAANNPRGYPRWDGSEAERLLKIDINGCMRSNMKPCILYQKKGVSRISTWGVSRSHLPRGPQSHGKPLLVSKEEEVSCWTDGKGQFLSWRVGLIVA